MSKWIHSLCEACYRTLEPDKTPVQLVEPETETCCRCGERTNSGIYYRAVPELFKFCKHLEVRVCGGCGARTDSRTGYFAHIGGVGDYEFIPVCEKCRAKEPEAWKIAEIKTEKEGVKG